MDFIFNLTPGDVIYDIETYPNCFTFYAIHAETGQHWVFEISDRKDQAQMFRLFIHTLAELGCRMVGYNNIGFDYPVIHMIMQTHVTVRDIYAKAMSIINSFDDKFSHIIWDNNRVVPQLDLYKIHHFDNKARATSLKVLEFNMRSDSIEDLPFDVGLDITDEQKDVLIAYNCHDVEQTLKFYHVSMDSIRFREELSRKYDKNFLNHNDTKIGKDYFIMKLEERVPGSCYKMIEGKRQMVQTHRPFINLGEVILSYVQFEHPEFNRILTFFKNKTITETKGAFKDVRCSVHDFRFDFGTGGIHGSVENQIVTADDDYIIEDWDVASYYPNLAIANGLHPEHLGQEFCTIYKDVYEQRKVYAKGTSENAMLKLALNGVYGDSNNEYSPFYDPKYTMSITINGQLLLCMIADQLVKCPDMQFVQFNTDGLSIKYPRIHQAWVHSVMKWWEDLTKLTLESAEYSRMFIRDVNNYIAEYTDGKLKRKGTYEYEMGWHQNHSQLVVAKAAEAVLVRGEDIREFIMNHEDKMDFMLRVKLPRSNTLLWGGDKIQNVTRYYVSTDGDILEKIMPAMGPIGTYKRANKLTDSYYEQILKEVGDEWDERIHTKNKSKHKERRSGIQPGWTVQVCNDISECSFSDINYEYYIQEAKKLVEVLR